jgi:enamine deaminase RidA (YjgF/YER057c/UK114 family)
MTLERINPADLPTPETYTHVIVSTGSWLVFVAGQVAEDGQGGLVGEGDLAVQARQAFANVGRALAAGRARPDQVTKITIFVVGFRDGHLPAIEEGRVSLFGDHKPADTLVGVETLAHPGCLIEVEAIAVVDGPGSSGSS